MFFAKIFFYVHTTGLSFELGTFLCLDAAHEHLKGTKTGSLDVICQEMRGGFKLLHSIVPVQKWTTDSLWRAGVDGGVHLTGVWENTRQKKVEQPVWKRGQFLMWWHNCARERTILQQLLMYSWFLPGVRSSGSSCRCVDPLFYQGRLTKHISLFSENDLLWTCTV